MARYSIDGQILTDMADAIREKKGDRVIRLEGEMNVSNRSPEFGASKGLQYKVTITPKGEIEGDGIAGIYYYWTKSNSVKIYDQVTWTLGESQTFTFAPTNSSSTAYLTFGIKTYGTKITADVVIEELDENGKY